jgi:hypothetical protein
MRDGNRGGSAVLARSLAPGKRDSQLDEGLHHPAFSILHRGITLERSLLPSVQASAAHIVLGDS